MSLQIGDIAPDFEANTTDGHLKFHDYIDGSWVVFFSHPKDFTPVCTTELGSVAKMKHEFDKRGVKLIGISIDSVEDHKRWKDDIKDVTGATVNYPMIGDEDLAVAKLYGMIHPNASGSAKGRTAADNATVRNVFIIGPDKKIKFIVAYPMSTGRNFNEIVRVVDSLQLTATKSVATPADWKQGEDVIILASVSDEAAKVKYLIVPYTRGRGLDLGCGPFKAFPHFIGVDNGHHAKQFGWQMQPDVHVDTCESLPLFASGSMDFVFSSHLLEHTHDTRKALVAATHAKLRAEVVR